MSAIDELPPPQTDPRTPFIGLPLGYGVHPPSGVGAPNLTDTSVPGVYHAAVSVPSRAATVLNQVSARIGAPSLSNGPSPITIIENAHASGAPRPIASALPAFVQRAGNAVRIQARGIASVIGSVFRR